MTSSQAAVGQWLAPRHQATQLVLALVLALIAPAALATQAVAASTPVMVNVRVEGATTTIFEIGRAHV